MGSPLAAGASEVRNRLPDTRPVRAEILSGEGFRLLQSGTDEPWFNDRVSSVVDVLVAAKRRFYRKDDEFEENWRDKARIDAELLINTVRAMERAEEAGRRERWILVTGNSYLRRLPRPAREELRRAPDALAPGEAAFLASLLPDAPAPLKSLRALLYDTTFNKSLEAVEALALNVLRRAGSSPVPGAARGVLRAEFSDALVRAARERGKSRAEYERSIRNDPVTFGRLAAAAAEACGLSDAVEREHILGRIESLADGWRDD